MSTLIPTSLLVSAGLKAAQAAADAAFGPGKLTIAKDSSGLDLGFALAGQQTVHFDDLSLDGGLSGHVYIDGLAQHPLSATLLDGFACSLRTFDLTMSRSALVASNVAASLTLPFFTDDQGHAKTVDVELSTRADGSLVVSLAANETQQPSTPEGLIQLQYNLPGGLGSVELQVSSLEVDKSADGVWTLLISGNLVLETSGLSFPKIEFQNLGITSKGQVSLKGGWIDLPSHTALDFFGFHVGLEKLGFGNESNGDRWIGFNGEVRLVEGLSLGGTARGLRINLSTGAVSLDSVGISFAIPDVLSIDGEIDFIHVKATKPEDLAAHGLNPTIYGQIPGPPSGPKDVNVFAGQVKVVVSAAGGPEADASFIAGTFGGASVFFLDIDVELPAGIPIFADVALFGLQGLVATGLQPQPAAGQSWWDWYKADPAYSATAVQKWMAPKPGAFALGAGATIGTEADDGFTVSAAVMLVVMLPGPVISLVGKANILSKRIGGAQQEANFEAMATLDGNAGTFDLMIEAKYKIPLVLDIEGTAALHVDAPSKQWYFALGKPPKDQRIKARIFDLFEADSYFVISDSGLITGAWIGYRNSWKFGPLSASVDAYMATLAAIQWSPLQLAGGIELHGSIKLKAFGIGVGITADALLEGCAPNPFYIHGELSVELDLPWPLPNVGATISLTWGGDDGTLPPPPLALNTVKATLECHGDATGKPASDHYTLLRHGDSPIDADYVIADSTLSYDRSRPGILGLSGADLNTTLVRLGQAVPTPGLNPNGNSTVQAAPMLPLDSQFVLTFAHPTEDATGSSLLFGAQPFASFPPQDTPGLPPAIPMPTDDMSNINPNPPVVTLAIRHSLLEVALMVWVPGTTSWQPVCTTQGANANPSTGDTALAGVWLQDSSGNTSGPMTRLRLFPYGIVPASNNLPLTPVAILPKPGALYALRTVTRIQARRGGTTDFQSVPQGDRVIEYTYFQTAAGPGTHAAVSAFGKSLPIPEFHPALPPPFPNMAVNCGPEQQPASVSPQSGALQDLTTYTQWSWPLGDDAPAYYGYDLGVEFVESYVNQLYTAFSAGSAATSLHFRCVDRNHHRTLLLNTAIHVPSVPAQSAVVATVSTPDIPKNAQAPSLLRPVIGGLGQATQGIDVSNALRNLDPAAVAAALQPGETEVASQKLKTDGSATREIEATGQIDATRIHLQGDTGGIAGKVVTGGISGDLSGGLAGGGGIEIILKQLQQVAAAKQFKELWFRPLYPSTRYTLDVVAGPADRTRISLASLAGSKGSLGAIGTAADPIAALAALKDYIQFEDQLTTLKRIEFTTSRYSTFTAQVANATAQLNGAAAATPVRNYTSTTEPVKWLGTSPVLATYKTALESYLDALKQLNTVVSIFNPIADRIVATKAPAPAGNQALVAKRAAAIAAWKVFSAASITLFDGLVEAFGHPEWKTGQPPVRVPDTEISLFLNPAGFTTAILLESPEPLPWQRIWSLAGLIEVTGRVQNLGAVWSADGTRALLLPATLQRGSLSLAIGFLGNIGAQAPCILLNGAPVVERATLGNVPLGPPNALLPPNTVLTGSMLEAILKLMTTAHL